jgi:hypothetical protein
MGLLNLIARSEGIQPNMQTIRGLLTLLDTGGNHHAQQNESMFSDHFENKEKADA